MTWITVADVRACGYCSRGSRYFAQQMGLDWSRFIRQGGIDSREFEHIDDAMMKAVIEAARQREAANGQE